MLGLDLVWGKKAEGRRGKREQGDGGRGKEKGRREKRKRKGRREQGAERREKGEGRREGKRKKEKIEKREKGRREKIKSHFPSLGTVNCSNLLTLDPDIAFNCGCIYYCRSRHVCQ